MSNQKPHQFDIQQAKKQQQWAVDMQAAKQQWDTDSSKATEIARNRLACVELATRTAKQGDDPLELAQKLDRFVNEPVNAVEFRMPQKPVMDSNIKTLS